jgi:hypothetical protein
MTTPSGSGTVGGQIVVSVVHSGSGGPVPPGGGGIPTGGPVPPGMGGPSAAANASQQRQQSQNTQQQTGLQRSMASGIRQLTGIFAAGYMLKQSKIVTTTLSTISQMIGAIIDIFLMPFIPILVPIMKMIGKFIANLVPIFTAISRWVSKFMEDPWGAIKDLARGLFSKEFWADTFKFLTQPENWLVPLGTLAVLNHLFGGAPAIGIAKLFAFLFGPIIAGSGKVLTWVFGAAGNAVRALIHVFGRAGNAMGALTHVFGRAASIPGKAILAHIFRGVVLSASSVLSFLFGGAALAGVAANKPFDRYAGRPIESLARAMPQVPSETVRKQILMDIQSTSGMRGQDRASAEREIARYWEGLLDKNFGIDVNVNVNAQGQVLGIESQGRYEDISPRWNTIP